MALWPLVIKRTSVRNYTFYQYHPTQPLLVQTNGPVSKKREILRKKSTQSDLNRLLCTSSFFLTPWTSSQELQMFCDGKQRDSTLQYTDYQRQWRQATKSQTSIYFLFFMLWTAADAVFSISERKARFLKALKTTWRSFFHFLCVE